MKIAIDGMGDDNAPGAVVQGASLAVKRNGAEVAVVGPPAIFKVELTKAAGPKSGLEIVPASEWLVEGEHPALALRKKKDASVTVAMRMVKEGREEVLINYGWSNRNKPGGLSSEPQPIMNKNYSPGAFTPSG
jgi:glycerol-3-phosphate acyltransferase PlsX